MRRVLDGVTDEWQPVLALAATIDRNGGSAEVSIGTSCRRACKRLAETGLVELGYMSVGTGEISKDLPGKRALLVMRRRPAPWSHVLGFLRGELAGCRN